MRIQKSFFVVRRFVLFQSECPLSEVSLHYIKILSNDCRVKNNYSGQLATTLKFGWPYGKFGWPSCSRAHVAQ